MTYTEGSYQQPNPAPQGAIPPAKAPFKWWIIVIIAAVLMLCCCLVIVLLYYLSTSGIIDFSPVFGTLRPFFSLL